MNRKLGWGPVTGLGKLRGQGSYRRKRLGRLGDGVRRGIRLPGTVARYFGGHDGRLICPTEELRYLAGDRLAHMALQDRLESPQVGRYTERTGLIISPCVPKRLNRVMYLL